LLSPQKNISLNSTDSKEQCFNNLQFFVWLLKSDGSDEQIFTALRTVSLWSQLRKRLKRRGSEKSASQKNYFLTPPSALQQLERVSVHGVEIVDPYSWMQDIQHPRVQKYLQEEQQYTEKVMSSTISLQKLFYRVPDHVFLN
jgi:hypothetical protein